MLPRSPRDHPPGARGGARSRRSPPAGHLNLLGLYVDSVFLRGTLDKLKIEPQFTTAGEYNNAGDAFTGYGHSPAARDELEVVLDDLYQQIVNAIAAGRGLESTTVLDLIDEAPIDGARALEAGLVDALSFPDEFESRLEEVVGERPSTVATRDYAGRGPRRGRRVAVVFSQGTIVRGPRGIDNWSLRGQRSTPRHPAAPRRRVSRHLGTPCRKARYGSACARKTERVYMPRSAWEARSRKKEAFNKFSTAVENSSGKLFPK